MARHRLGIFLHIVWSTAERVPCIAPEIERRLHRSIQAEVRRMGATVLALGGTEDHVHLLLLLPTTVALADLMQQVKGVSSQVGSALRGEEALFRWQHGYGAFSLSPTHVDAAKTYIRNQKRHHAEDRLWNDWETAEMPDAKPRRPHPPRRG